jgi:hypothetical protein
MFKQLRKLFFARAADEVEGLLVNAYCTVAEVANPSFALRLHGRRDNTDAEMRHQLGGFFNYVQSLGEGRMTQTRYQVMRHIQRTRHQISFTMAPEDRDALAAWALEANAVVLLPDGHVRDPQGRVLVSSADGSAEPDAIVPFPAAARQRKQATEALLAARGLHPAAPVPPVVAEPELGLRTSTETGRRAIALLAVAMRAESLAAGQDLPAGELERRLPGLRAALSPEEAGFLAAAQPPAEVLPRFSWRYESLRTLEWALGLTDLPWPDQPSDAAPVARVLLERAKEAAAGKLALRPASEILDALDLHYRLHWLLRQAHRDGTTLPTPIDAGVVSERHAALNWLTRFEDANWDDTDTPT